MSPLVSRTTRTMAGAALLGIALAAAAGTTNQPSTAPPADPPCAIAPLHGEPCPELDGRYLVILEEDADLAAVRSIAETLGAEIRHEYTTCFRGFAGSLSDGAVEVLRRLAGVAYLEHDQKVGAQVSWALDRIDQRNLPFDSAFTPTYKGAGVNIYVLDTGINVDHVDFGGRASVAYDAVGSGDGYLGYGIDCNGHGTWVASLAGSNTYGVATSANIYGVRVLDCDGGGAVSDVTAGCDWVASNGYRPAVACLALAAPASETLDNAVSGLMMAGVTTAVAAGSGAPPSELSPAREASSVTVGCTDINDHVCRFSSGCSVIDILAPGADVPGLWHTSNDATIILSGTSASTGLTAGVLAALTEEFPSKPASQLKSQLLIDASTFNWSPPCTGINPPCWCFNKLLFIY